MKLKRGCAFILVIFLVAVLILFTLAAPVGASYDGDNPDPAVPLWMNSLWMNSLWIPFLCGAPFILGVIWFFGWLASSYEDHQPDPQYPPKSDTVHNLYDRAEYAKFEEHSQRLHRNDTGRRHDGPHTINVNGKPSDLAHMDFSAQVAARALIERNDPRARVRFTQGTQPGGKRQND